MFGTVGGIFGALFGALFGAALLSGGLIATTGVTYFAAHAGDAIGVAIIGALVGGIVGALVGAALFGGRNIRDIRAQEAPTTANDKKRRAGGTDDWGAKRLSYQAAALQLYNDGQEHFEAASQERRSQLKAFQTRDITAVKIVTGVDRCTNCAPHTDRELTLSNAIEQMIIPEKKCTHAPKKDGGVGWCRCLYVPVIEIGGSPTMEAERERRRKNSV